jgi:hypothetical protein
MVIAPTNAIHTFFMRFPIDVLFVRRNGVVAKVRRNIPPWRAAASLWAYAVIELPAGTLSVDDVKVGDVLTVVAAVEGVVEAPPLARACPEHEGEPVEIRRRGEKVRALATNPGATLVAGT